jgi:hypothetical protein
VFLDAPRGLRDPDAFELRLRMLSLARVRDLTKWTEMIAETRGVRMPYPDPADGGVDAKVLILLETPTQHPPEPGEHPGFISVDNDTAAAEEMWRARELVSLQQGTAMHWNIVPWYPLTEGTGPKRAETRDGCALLLELLVLLPRLETVINCGLETQKAWHEFVGPRVSDLEVIDTWHPATVAMAQEGKRDDLRDAFRRAARRTF